MRNFTEQELVRRGKLEEISKVCNPYPEKYERTHTLKEAATLEDGTKVRLTAREKRTLLKNDKPVEVAEEIKEEIKEETAE